MTSTDEKPSRVMRWLEERVNLTEFFSSLTILGIFYTELDTRKPLRQALHEALSRPLPAYDRWPRILGPLSLLVFLMQIVSGILLAFYYQPTPEAAHESIRTIVSETRMGWFMHQIHNWGSPLLIVLLLLRILRLAYDGFFRPPRELLWIGTVLLLFVALHADFTGALLGWSNEAYWSVVRGIEVLTAIPVIGRPFVWLVGGSTISDLTLTRFYVLHLSILPLLILALYAVTFGTVRRVGLTEIPREQEAPGSARYQAHLINLLISMLFLFGGLVTLAVLAPLPFNEVADPLQTPAAASPPWYLLAPYAVLEVGPAVIPHVVRGLLILLGLVALLAVPFIVGRKPPGRWRIWLTTTLVLLVWIALTLLGAAFEGWSL